MSHPYVPAKIIVSCVLVTFGRSTMSDAPKPKPESDEKTDTTTITIRVRDQVSPCLMAATLYGKFYRNVCGPARDVMRSTRCFTLFLVRTTLSICADSGMNRILSQD